jgi:hypothetical protein
LLIGTDTPLPHDFFNWPNKPAKQLPTWTESPAIVMQAEAAGAENDGNGSDSTVPIDLESDHEIVRADGDPDLDISA